MVDPRIALLCVFLGPLVALLHGCGGDIHTTPAPPPTGPQIFTAPDPADMTFTIPSPKSFHCIKKFPNPTGYKAGFYMFRWTTKKEAETLDVDTDTFGDINPYYLLANLMTVQSGLPAASKTGGCNIPHCGIQASPDGGGCVLERVFIKMNNEGAKDILVGGGIWGQYMNADNGITDNYPYWATNWTGVLNPNGCENGPPYTPTCNFYFQGGYPVGCQTASDVTDLPVWYSTTGACPLYPYDPAKWPRGSTPDPPPGWTTKVGKTSSDPAAQDCRRSMPGGNNCKKGDPWTAPSPTCTWQAKKAGYLTIEDVFNIETEPGKTRVTYKDWCKEQSSISDWAVGADPSGIPSGITLFYGLSEVAHPVMKGIRSDAWHNALAVDDPSAKDHLSPEQIDVFKAWAKSAKARLNAMFDEMDTQAFKQFNDQGLQDPDGAAYKDCVSNGDVQAPPCAQSAPPR